MVMCGVCSGCKAGTGFLGSTHAANLGPERLLHDEYHQSAITDDGSLYPCSGRQREGLECAADTKH